MKTLKFGGGALRKILDPLREVYEKFSLKEGGPGKIFPDFAQFRPGIPLPIINDQSLRGSYIYFFDDSGLKICMTCCAIFESANVKLN